MIVNMIDYLRDRLQKVIYCCYGVMIFIVAWSITVDKSYAHSWAEKMIPGFWSLFALCSCGIVIMVARWFGKSGIQTREDYYDK
ncbi:hypothetical protein JYT30_00070 [Desulfotalea psychrophila]|uniref:Uncharacterized protein n=1 Tax=Desulfotalea psychrophila TaxID=84980 RepID=A0ABS3ATW6_9BACT|nr:hypothetical protein [Desulfocapsa sp.]MBN4060162.1 hypothetical protein [Desulfotalea psychrophila]MBN4068544.1 hypothetical protein [Desulfotalea psychrophila]MBN4071540.1 hypothetical protein [Desulfotalea psychrophila]